MLLAAVLFGCGGGGGGGNGTATPGGGTSSALAFTVTAVNPVPTLSTLAPSSALQGGPAFTLTVTGSNFVAASVISTVTSPPDWTRRLTRVADL